VWDPEARDGRLAFHENTAVHLDRAATPDRQGRYRLRYRVDPVLGETASLGWVSAILTSEPDTLGWVTRADARPGLLVRSNGALQLFHGEVERAVAWRAAPPEPASEYRVTLTVALVEDASGTRLVLDGEVNGAAFHALLREGVEATLPPRAWWVFGAHFHPNTVTESWLDDVEIPADS
jgi:hypothetical protein